MIDPLLSTRVICVTITILVALAVIGAGVALGVIVSRYVVKSPFSQTETEVYRSNATIALDRLIASNELERFYDQSGTLNDLATSLNTQLKSIYSLTGLKFVVSGFSGKPILTSTLAKKRQLNERPSVVIVNGSIYFTQNYTAAQVRQAFVNFTRSITLLSVTGQPSTATATFSNRYSTFTDTYRVSLTINETLLLSSISFSNTSVILVTPSVG